MKGIKTSLLVVISLFIVTVLHGQEAVKVKKIEGEIIFDGKPPEASWEKTGNFSLVQYVNAEDQLLTNFRLRYNPREGNDFYLVYNDNRGINYNIVNSESPRFFNRTIMVKYIHTFIL